MTKIKFLDDLVAFTEDVVKDIILPLAPQERDTANSPTSRAAEVYKMRLPDSAAAKKKVPYIIHQIVSGKDTQPEGQYPSASATVRSIFAVYCKDESEGAMNLLNLMERVRIALEQQVVIGHQFELDLKTGVDMLIYPDDTAPYFIGEMSTVWNIPAIRREVRAL